MSSAPAAQPAASFEIIPSQYVIMPKHGVCVITGFNTMEAGGIVTDVTVLRPVKDLKSTIMKPTHRLAHVGIRPPLDAATLQDILHKAFSAIKGDGGGMWRHREEAHNNLIATGNAENMAAVLNKILSKHRSPKWKEKNVAADLPSEDKFTISYSERQIVNTALKLLSEEISHATGLREKDTRTMLLRAALVPGFAANIKLSGQKAAPPLMDVKQFHEIFGHAPGEAIGTSIKINTVTRTPSANAYQGHERGTSKRFSGGGREDRAEPKVVRLRVQPTAGFKPKGPQSDVPAASRAVFKQEESYAPVKGIMRGLFMVAARILEPQEFEILSRTTLRAKANLESMKVAAHAMGMDVAEVIEVRNAAAAKVAAASPYDLNKPKAPKILQPYEEAPVKVKAVREPKPPREPKAPRQTKEKYVLAEGNRPLFESESHMMSTKGMMRGLFLTAGRVLEPDAFQIVAQTALRRGGRLSMEQAAAAMALPLEDAIILRNRAMATLVQETGYDPDGPRAPSVLKPYEVKPVFERVAGQKKAPAPKIDRAIKVDNIGLVEDKDDVVVTIRMPKAAIENSFGLKINIDWDKVAGAVPEILKAEGGIKSKGSRHAANGSAELAEPAIQPPPSTLDPS